jgi:hypothetical protein
MLNIVVIQAGGKPAGNQKNNRHTKKYRPERIYGCEPAVLGSAFQFALGKIYLLVAAFTHMGSVKLI